MNRKTAKFIAIITAIAMVVTSISFLGMSVFSYGATEVENINSDKYLEHKMDSMEEFLKYIKKNYKDEVTYEKLINAAFEGAITSLDDKYSEFYKNEEETKGFQNAVAGEYEGIGVTLKRNSKTNVITAVNPNGDAFKQGIKEQDIIVKVDGRNVEDKTTSKLVQFLRGKAGTKVKVTVKRDGILRDYIVTRQKIKLQSVFGEIKDGNIGYIKITSFDSDVYKEFKKEYQELLDKGVKYFILDLRNNTGGYIKGAIKIANLFMDDGKIATYSQRDKVLAVEKANKKIYKVLPTVILTNKYTASASELLTAALKENKIAKTVGTTTFGKGIAQKVHRIDDENSAKLSIFYFNTPSGKKIHKVGIHPDYPVKEKYEGNKLLQARYNGFASMIEETKPKKGDTGLNVYAAQQRLNLLGYLGEVSVDSSELNVGQKYITGHMGKATEDAVKKFQKDVGLSPYGVLDYTTMIKLDKEAYAKAYGSVSSGNKDLQLEKAIEVVKK